MRIRNNEFGNGNYRNFDLHTIPKKNPFVKEDLSHLFRNHHNPQQAHQAFNHPTRANPKQMNMHWESRLHNFPTLCQMIERKQNSDGPFEHPGAEYPHPGPRPRDPLPKPPFIRLPLKLIKKNRRKIREYHDNTRKWETNLAKHEQEVPILKAQDKAIASLFCMLTHDLSNAQKLLKEALSFNKNNSLSYANQAYLHAHLDNMEEATKALDKSIENLPEILIDSDDQMALSGMASGVLHHLIEEESTYPEAWALAQLLNETNPSAKESKIAHFLAKAVRNCIDILDKNATQPIPNIDYETKGFVVGTMLDSLRQASSFGDEKTDYQYLKANTQIQQAACSLAVLHNNYGYPLFIQKLTEGITAHKNNRPIKIVKDYEATLQMMTWRNPAIVEYCNLTPEEQQFMQSANVENSEIIDLGKPEIPGIKTFWCNGILNTKEQAVAQGNKFSEMIGNKNVVCAFNATQGNSDIKKYRDARHGIFPEIAQSLADNWTQYLQEDPNGTIIQIAHSYGCCTVSGALALVPPEIRNRIKILAIAPGQFIDANLCQKVNHITAKLDPVTYLDPLGRMIAKNQRTLVVLESNLFHNDADDTRKFVHYVDHAIYVQKIAEWLEANVPNYVGIKIDEAI